MRDLRTLFCLTRPGVPRRRYYSPSRTEHDSEQRDQISEPYVSSLIITTSLRLI